MPRFSRLSAAKLATCDKRLQDVFNEVIKRHDCTVTYGHRSVAEQNELYRAGKTQLRGGRSKHNSTPSKAVDVVAYPIDWKNIKRFYYFAGVAIGTALSMGIKLRWGGDWDSDNDLDDQNFNDLVHFEIAE